MAISKQNITRRTFVDRALKGSLLSLSFKVGGSALLMTPREARAKELPLQHLDTDQAGMLERLGEAIVPGSVDSGLVHFIDHQFGVEPDDCMLIAKFFQVEPPYKNFYLGGLSAMATAAEQNMGKPIDTLDESELKQFIQQISKPGTMVDGYPLFLFYLCLRSDGVDVVYGTPEGFRELNVPYMAHILPPEGWNG